MLEPLDRYRRDSTLFQFTDRSLRDFIDPEHLLIQIDEQLDLAKLVAPLEHHYCRDHGRPAIHPEVMVRATANLFPLQYRLLQTSVFGHLGEHGVPLVLLSHH